MPFGNIRLRRPEYTGENRCNRCTVVNVVISLLLAGSLTVGLWVFLGEVAGVVGFGVFLVCLSLIYLRGYLVPGTPALTRGHMPEWMLEKFGKTPGRGRDPAEIRRTLERVDAIGPCEGGTDICLTDEFASEWRDEMRTSRPSLFEEATAIFGDGVELVGEGPDDSLMLREDDKVLMRWESEATAHADVTAYGILRGRVDDWNVIGNAEKFQILRELRLFLEDCPRCESDLSLARDPSRRASDDVVTLHCEECGVSLYEKQIAS